MEVSVEEHNVQWIRARDFLMNKMKTLREMKNVSAEHKKGSKERYGVKDTDSRLF